MASTAAREAGTRVDSTQPITSAPPRTHDAVRVAVLVAFVLVVALAMSRHEMWRDELQAWVIARTSTTVPDLLHNIRYEGHPALWYLVLLPLTKITASPWLMQVAQLVIATATIAVVLWRAPFTMVQKALFAGGYYALFDYGTISRSYSLGFLMLVVTCAVASTRRRWPWAGITLALLALTSAFGAFVAVAVLLGLLVDEIVQRRLRLTTVPFARVATGFAVAFAGLVVAYAEAAPAGDAGVYKSWKTGFDAPLVRTSLAAIARALVPIPKFQHHWWNTSVLDGFTAGAALLGVVALLAIAWLLRHTPGACVIWVAGAVQIVIFLYSKIQYASASRYNGHIFLALTAALWLAPAMATQPGTRDRIRSNDRVRSRVFTAVLVLQLIGGAFAIGSNLRYPFSDAHEVAGYIDSQHLSNAIIVAIPDTTSVSVVGYLDHDVYRLAGGNFGSYVVWSARRNHVRQPLSGAIDKLSQRTERILVVSNHPLHSATGFDLHLLMSRTDAILRDEHFWLYRATPTGP